MTTKTHNPLALISVTDKTGVVPFAQGLVDLGYTILSTGGTAATLRTAGVAVTDVASFTDSPEILNGRVKTLHPAIHGGILMDRQNPEHCREANAHGIKPIDLIVVNLYQFAEQAVAADLDLSKAIEFIDIGGPTMLRGAAKNYRSSAPVIDPQDYDLILAELKGGELSIITRQRLAAKTFRAIANYDAMIANYFERDLADQQQKPEQDMTAPSQLTLQLKQIAPLRYGENPHQSAALYQNSVDQRSGFQAVKVLQGKELSYNNYMDVDAATGIVFDLSETLAVAIIKHTNPCGVATAQSGDVEAVFSKALACDPKSAFGGIVAVNRPVDGKAAEAMSQIFLECIAAPSFTKEALEVFAKKKNLRLLETPFLAQPAAAIKPSLTFRSIRGAMLAQSNDDEVTKTGHWECVTEIRPTSEQDADMAFAMTIAKHVKSNAIVYVKNLATVAIGAGQMSRIDAATFAAKKALQEGRKLTDSVLASDAFFPFRDTVDLAAKYGIKAIVQPGGSVRDQESIDACNEAGITMVFTGRRHFKH